MARITPVVLVGLIGCGVLVVAIVVVLILWNQSRSRSRVPTRGGRGMPGGYDAYPAGPAAQPPPPPAPAGPGVPGSLPPQQPTYPPNPGSAPPPLAGRPPAREARPPERTARPPERTAPSPAMPAPSEEYDDLDPDSGNWIDAELPMTDELADEPTGAPAAPEEPEPPTAALPRPVPRPPADEFGDRSPAPPTQAPAGERLSFTAAYPRQVVSEQWHNLLVVLHTPGAVAEVEALLTRRSPELDGAPTRISTEATAPVRRGTTLTLVPTVPDVEFNPARVEVAWHEDVQESTFRLRTHAAAGTPLYGAVEVYVGPLLIAVVPIGLRVAAPGAIAVAEPDVTQRARVLDRIFVSYSRRDAEVVRACTALYRALGVQVLMDTKDLRAGQDWREGLHRLISDADLFQLYWSAASAASSEVEHEWRYAQGLMSKGTGFIRPLYWESPMPEPPTELSTIHFSRVDLDEVRGHDLT